MAILDTSVTGSIVNDRDDNVFIGIELHFYRSNGPEGYFKSTTTTVDAVKQNVRNLLLTEKGERYFQPDLGIDLRKYLFEPAQPELSSAIEADILATFNLWLPFVNVKRVDINIEGRDIQNSIKIDIEFSIEQITMSLESVQIEI